VGHSHLRGVEATMTHSHTEMQLKFSLIRITSTIFMMLLPFKPFTVVVEANNIRRGLNCVLRNFKPFLKQNKSYFLIRILLKIDNRIREKLDHMMMKRFSQQTKKNIRSKNKSISFVS